MVAAAGEALPARRSPAGAGCAETGGPGVLGTSNLNVTIPGFVSPTTTTLRTYATEQDLMTELVNARVWIGYHFRTSTAVGEDLGHSVAAWTMQRFFLAGDDQSGDD